MPVRRSPITSQTHSPDGRRSSSRTSGSRGRSAEQTQRALERAARNLRFAEEHAASVRGSDVTRDPDGSYHRRCRELADVVGVDVAVVLEEWEERAAIREYLGAVDREESNRLAFGDVLDRLRPQRVLL